MPQVRKTLVRWDKSGGFPFHDHGWNHTLEVVEGKITVEIHGANWEFGPGMKVTIPTGVPHKVRALEDGTLVIFDR